MQKSKVSIKAVHVLTPCLISFNIILLITFLFCRSQDHISKQSSRLCSGKELVNWYGSVADQSLTIHKRVSLSFNLNINL